MKDFSIQLYSLREIPTLKERLQMAANAGFNGVEFAGYEDIPAAEMKALLTSLGLRGTGSHISQDALKDNLDGCVAYCLEAGITSAACPCINIRTRDDAIEAAAFLEECAKAFTKEGIPFCYHNHAHEFETADGQYLLEIMMENTKLLGFELDVYWAAYAGADPVAFMEKHRGRFPLLHFKEIAADKRNVELGLGLIDFQKLTALGLAQGTKEFIVEQEEFTMPVSEGARTDAVYMSKL